MAGALLGVLYGVRIVRECLHHFLTEISGYNNGVILGEEIQSVQNIMEQGMACGHAHDLGHVVLLGLEPGALAGGKDHCFYRFHAYPSNPLTMAMPALAPIRSAPALIISIASS